MDINQLLALKSRDQEDILEKFTNLFGKDVAQKTLTALIETYKTAVETTEKIYKLYKDTGISNTSEFHETFRGLPIYFIPDLKINKRCSFLVNSDTIAVGKLDVSNATNLNYLFCDGHNLCYVAPTDTSNVKNMENTFDKCMHLKEIPQWDFSHVEMGCRLFSKNMSLTHVDDLDIRSMIDASGMFLTCGNLKKASVLTSDSLDSVRKMFQHCRQLESVSISDTSSVTDASKLFNRAEMLNNVVFDMQSVIDATNMFHWCTSLSKVKLTNIRTDIDFYWEDYDYNTDYYITGNCPLEHDTIISIINNLVPNATDDYGDPCTLTLGPDLIAKLTPEEIQMATDKGWTIA